MAFVVFAGQSNMGGPLQNGSSLTQPWVHDPKTLIWDGGAFAPLQPGVNTGYGGAPNGWGPEVAFARAFRARFPDEELRILKSVWGGTQLAVDPVQWAYDWSPASDAELFDRTTEAIRATGLRPAAVFWGQGEEDAANFDDARAYAHNLPGFFSAVRAEWLGDPAGKIGFFRIGASPPFSGLVRDAQLAADNADPNAASFDGGFPTQGDDLHYSAAGLDMAGEAFFDLYVPWRGAAPGPAPTGEDTLIGGDGPDSFGGGDGHDMIRGAAGDDRISGGDAFDDLHGNTGDDTVAGDADDDWVVGGQGDDVLFGGDGGDLCYGQLGEDTVDGGNGDDAVIGGQANDVLIGGAGQDILSGDRGDDTVSGGPGADVFRSFGQAGLDRITDFSAADGDRVQLAPGSAWALTQEGGDAVVTIDGAARVVLVGVALAGLPDGWLFGG